MINEQQDATKIQVIEIVEDDLSLRNALQHKFIHEGFDVLSAKNGEEGLAVALSQRPDMILLDIVMPKMDGMTMMRKLRQENQWGKDVPIILLTNLSAYDEKINKAIADDEPAYYLVKSDWTMVDLVAKVRERLSREA